MRKFHNFEQFWRHYLREHSHPRTRSLHIVGTTLAWLMILAWLVTGYESCLVLAVLGGYGLAWISHFMIEDNRPATFWHPLWSLRADLRMYWKWLEGSLDYELRRAGVRQRYAPRARMGQEA